MDLKSPNILLGETGVAKIADVGLARVMGSESIVHQVVCSSPPSAFILASLIPKDLLWLEKFNLCRFTATHCCCYCLEGKSQVCH